MARIYKSCQRCGYLYDYNAYICCPECGEKQIEIIKPIQECSCED